MTGLRAKQPLPPPLLEDPHVLSEEARQEWGVVRLPVDMDEALKSSVEHDTGAFLGLGGLGVWWWSGVVWGCGGGGV